MKNSTKIMCIAMLAAFIMSTAVTYAQKSGNGKVVKQEREVADFTGIKLECSADVIITQGEKSVVVKTDENLQEIVTTEVNNGILVIDIEGRGYRSCKVMEVIVSIPDLTRIKNTGSGDIEIKGIYKCRELVVGISGSGDFDAVLDAKNLEIKGMGSGDIEVSGITGMFKAQIMGSGDVDAEDLRLEQCYVKCTGSGDIELEGKTEKLIIGQSGSGDLNAYNLSAVSVDATNSGSGDLAVTVATSLKVSLNGSGDLTYNGNPEKVDVRTNGSGDVYKR